jgi:hypothetical protein
MSRRARPLRIQLADAWCHVTARGLERRDKWVGLDNYHAAAQAIRRLSARLQRDQHLRRFMSAVINFVKV